jgi:hypothetical protein
VSSKGHSVGIQLNFLGHRLREAIERYFPEYPREIGRWFE